MPRLEDYRPFVGEGALEEIKSLGQQLTGRRVVHVNSTRVGGGVVEILQKLIPLMEEAGVEGEWLVIKGDEDFFRVTKGIHNALHGAEAQLQDDMIRHYISVNEENAKELDLNDADFVVIHDPQPAPLIKFFPKRKGKWIWRCHIDISTPKPYAWELLKQFVALYDAAVFHVDKFAKRDLRIRQYIIPPSIDPLSLKNRDLSPNEINSVLEKFRISRKLPLITQIGRFDRLKDPEGVVEMYQKLRNPEQIFDVFRVLRGEEFLRPQDLIKESLECQLLLAGSLAEDDPEGNEVYQNVRRRAGKDKDVHILLLPPTADLEINAFQRASSVVLQKSLKEGFALTVSEALWKEKPVIGGRTGGIPLQIIDGGNGFLVDSVEQAGERVRYLLRNPEKARQMGEAGREHVRKNFLITRHLRDSLVLLLTLEKSNMQMQS